MKFNIPIIILMLISAFQPAYAVSLKCTAQHRLFRGDTLIKASYQFTLNKGKGTIKIEGSIKESHVTHQVSRELKVQYIEHRGLINFEHIKVVKNPLDDTTIESIQRNLPRFFWEAGSLISFSIERVGKDSFVLTYKSMPYFFCAGVG